MRDNNQEFSDWINRDREGEADTIAMFVDRNSLTQSQRVLLERIGSIKAMLELIETFSQYIDSI